MKLFLFSALAVALLSGSAFSQVPIRPGDVKIEKVSPSVVKTPEFAVNLGGAPKRFKAADWFEVEVEFQTTPELVSELTFVYKILINQKMLVGEVTHVDIPKGREHFSVAYIAPRTLETIMGGHPLTNAAIQGIWVEAQVSGAKVSDLSTQKGQVAPNVMQVPGKVLNKSQTPFAPLYWDRYEALKRRRADFGLQGFSPFMAAPKRIVSLDLGTQSVSLAEFHSNASGGLVLHAYRSTELLADPAADATRLAQAKIAVTEMVNASGLKGQPINYAIAAQSVFTRFVKLPSVGEEQVDQIVGFEAQQNVPYPINEVVWDYQLVETGDSAQVEVVIVAIKSDLLDEINDSVEASGAHTTIVDVSPMALVNAFRYNYSDVPGCSLIIDIGARTTNLVFIESHKVFSRSISSGGNTITAAIAKEFHEPFGASEERKKRDGFVSLGGAYADPDDPDVARVSKITRNTMTRLHSEIGRSVSFYRSQQNGSAPTRIFLAGATTSMPYMREFFQEKFQMPVEFFNPLRNVTVSSTQDVEELGRKAHTLGGLVGLALRSVSSCPMELNLRPAGVIRRQQAARQRPAFILASLGILAGLAAWYLYYDRATTLTNEYTENKITPEVQRLEGLAKRMDDVVTQTKAQQVAAGPLLEAVIERDYWVKILNDINSKLPADYIWIVNFEPQVILVETPAPKTPLKAGLKPPPTTATIVQIRGLYLRNPQDASVVDTFLENLEKSELYTIDKEKLTRTVPDTPPTAWAYEYSFPLKLKQPISFSVPTIAAAPR